MSDDHPRLSRRKALQCMAYGGAGTLFVLAGGVFTPVDLAMADEKSTVVNGHIHQIMQKVEGNITFHTARSTAHPQAAPGDGLGPAPLNVAEDEPPRWLGITSVSVVKHPSSMALTDATLA